MPGLLEGKTVLITGSTTGIGEATARLCVTEGARVMIHGRNEERARALQHDLGDETAYVLGDLGEPEVCELAVSETVGTFGAIDAIANNAALTWRATLEETDADTFDRMIAVNLRAPILVIRAAMPHFLEQGYGTVVNIGSVNALCGQPNLLPYSAAKGGLATATRNMANGLARQRIRVNQLNCGWVASPNEIALQQSEGRPPGWENDVSSTFAPSGKLLAPEEVAEHVVFWLSDNSAPASGCVYELEQYSFIGRNAETDR
jgi:NAD(P)-dependent dehydrogenase (short-subunit alcohol dehydrogenase family)